MDLSRQLWKILRRVERDFTDKVREFLVIGDKGEGVIMATEPDGEGFLFGEMKFGGKSRTTTEPTRLNVHNLVRMAQATKHIVLLTGEGQLYTLGANDYGQLGQEIVNSLIYLTPQIISSTHRFTDVRCGCWHSLALTEDGKVWAWGMNYNRQVGLASSTSHIPSLRQITELDCHRVVAIECGGRHSLALTDKGQVYGWGANDYGQLAQETLSDQLSPVQLPIASSITQIAAGMNHSLLQAEDGLVFACGQNDSGQLGLPISTSKSPSLCQVSGLPSISQIASHFETNLSIALSTDRQCFVWGDVLNQIKSPTRLRLPAIFSTIELPFSLWPTCRNTPHSVRIEDSDTQTSDSDWFITDSGTQTSDSDTQTSDSDTQTSDSDTQTTDSDTQTTDSDTQTSDSDTQTPDSDTQTSDSDTQTTDSRTQITDSGTQTTDSRTQITDSSTETTNSCTQTTNSCTQTTDSCTQTTDSGTQTTDSGTQAEIFEHFKGDSNLIPSSKFSSNPLSDRVSRMFDNPDSGPDLQFVLREKSILAHRSVLQRSSANFAGLFSESCIRSADLRPSSPSTSLPQFNHTSPITQITIHDQSYLAFHSFLGYIYTGLLQVPVDLLPDVFELSQRFECLVLQQLCLSWMLSTVSLSNCCPYYQLADRHRLFYFQSQVVKFIADHPLQVFGSAAFRSMDLELIQKLSQSVAELEPQPKSQADVSMVQPIPP